MEQLAEMTPVARWVLDSKIRFGWDQPAALSLIEDAEPINCNSRKQREIRGSARIDSGTSALLQRAVDATQEAKDRRSLGEGFEPSTFGL
jgi:hypothetical protein